MKSHYIQGARGGEELSVAIFAETREAALREYAFRYTPLGYRPQGEPDRPLEAVRRRERRERPAP